MFTTTTSLFASSMMKRLRLNNLSHFQTFSKHYIRFSSQPGYSLRKLTMDDKAAVADFVTGYLRDEPLNAAVKLLQTPGSRCVELEEKAVSSLHHGVSIAAVDEKQNLVGVILNEIFRAKEPIFTNQSESCENPKFRKILQVLEQLDSGARMWELLPETCRAVLYVNMGAIHTEWRGRGLTEVLCKASEGLAKSVGANAMRMDCTSAFTAMAAERMQYRKVYAISFKGLDLPFLPEPPHLEAAVYLKEI